MERDELENLASLVLEIEIKTVHSCTLRMTCFKTG